MGLDGLLGAKVPIRPRLVVLADLDHREVERAESLANRSQTRKEPRIPRVVDPMASAQQRIARPQLRPVIEEHASRGVPRRHRPESQVSEGAGVPPVELDDLRRGNAPPLEVRSHAEWSDESNVAVLEGDNRRVIEVIVV